jgi:carbon starvation protein
VIRNDYVNASLTLALMLLVVALVVLGIRAAMKARRSPAISSQETPYVAA